MSFAIVTAPVDPGWTWGKPTFYYRNGLSGLTATSTLSGTNVANLLDRLEVNFWIATSTATQYITFDAGTGNEYTADYFAVANHNVTSQDGLINLQYSSDNFSGDINDAFTAEKPASDHAFVKQFTAISSRYWRAAFTSMGDSARASVMYWGEKTELDFASSSFDPNESEYIDTINESENGVLLGIHKKYRRRQFNFRIQDADSDLYDTAENWFNTVGLEPFFVTWNYDEKPNDAYYMRSTDGRFEAPYRLGNGDWRDLIFRLEGRVDGWL
jgi:hypothetical protein